MQKTVVIYRMGSLGDTVVSLPCFHKIVEKFPDYRRIVLTNIPSSNKAAPIEAILGNGGFTHGSISYPYRTRSIKRLWSLLSQLRSLRADTLIYVGGGRGVLAVYRDLAYFRLAGFRHVIGAPLTRSLDVGHRLNGKVEHESSRLARCLATLGDIDVNDQRNWDLKLTTGELARADAMLGEFAAKWFIAINTGGKLAVQDWGDANWASLLTRLGEKVSVPVVFVGGIDDRARADSLSASWKHLFLNACGLLSPRETSALLRRAIAFVGHDSGPLHLAAANGIPCVAVFGSNDPPGKWFPFGRNHRVHYNPENVQNIPPTDVEKSVLHVLHSRATAS